jgi:hypothetical protein
MIATFPICCDCDFHLRFFSLDAILAILGQRVQRDPVRPGATSAAEIPLSAICFKSQLM